MVSAQLSFRTANASDLEAVHALVHRGYRGEDSRVGWTTEADFLDGQRTDLDELRAILEDDGHVLLLAELAGELVGSCHLEAFPSHGYFGMFTVRPDRQSAGIGSSLLATAERFVLDQWGRERLRLVVIAERPEVIAWYERRGFALTGEEEPFPYGDERFGIPKRDDLYFVVLEKSLRPSAASGTQS